MSCTCGRQTDAVKHEDEEMHFCSGCKKLSAYCSCSPSQDQSGFSPEMARQAQLILNQTSDAKAGIIREVNDVQGTHA